MNGLDTIIRDNLTWHARALVASVQRGNARVPLNAFTAFQGYVIEDYAAYNAAVDLAWTERKNTRGL